MSKKYSVFITASFCLFIFGFGAALILSPSRDFSEQENRYPAQFKAPTLDTLRSGKFMEDFEDYVVDQFPLRDGWIQLKALSERALGKKENNKVYFGTDGQTLFAHFNAASRDDLAQRVGYVDKLAGNVDVPVYLALIPDKSYVWSGLLPAGAPNVDDGSTIAQVKELCGDGVRSIDLSDALSGDDVFYRTDHHWTTMGAYQGYLALARAMGVLEGSGDAPSYELRSDAFYGTTWSSAGAGWVPPDSIYASIPEGGTKGRVTVTGYPKGLPVESTMYHEEKLSAKDKYAYFLGGNQPLCVIKDPDAAGGKLLVIRDSYSDCLAPFLAESFQEVHLFDPRYSNMSLKGYVSDNDIDQVLVLYSVSNFTTDRNLFKLGQ